MLSLIPLLQILAAFPFQNSSKTPQERADDLISRLSLEQKVSLMMNESSAIDEFGIHSYNWWSEALHGAARAGIATVFPQAIGMAASWDDALLEKVFDVASTEQRIKFVQGRNELHEDWYHGLTVWTPNINIFRDPRWGRGQETYGEDPYLTSRMGAAVVRGLQGKPDSDGYDKLHACLKHYAVHSGPESSRHRFNAANVSWRDLSETYLYAFQRIINTTDVQEVMCAYNAFEGKPCCSSDKLLISLLRNEWGYKGLVVSDCGAIEDFYEDYGHKTHPDEASASADAVRTGTDLECGSSYKHLLKAVRNGQLKESELDRSLKRLLVARFRLGEMDPIEKVSWNRYPAELLDCPEHRALALKMARETMTLLHNPSGILPLSRTGHKIGIAGANATDSTVLFGNYNGFPRYAVTPLEGIQAKADNCIQAFGTDLVADEATADEQIAEMLRQLASCDVVIYFGGLSPRLEGEEMKVPFEGFMGGDRTSIELPAVQRRALRALHDAGKKVIFVCMSGSAVALSPETESCDAILQAWYPGEEGGTAIADVLFGEISPSGKLPVTFYASDDDLPAFENYNMEGRTYRYFNGKALWPFGFGLSYTTFEYGKADISHKGITLHVRNTGSFDADEVVQLYV
ncbi:MAG: glycoside hydrolase family 3 C-terminal domain-containing protein, partial [Alistipes sp.]|nr:glycoside hydrolase family 3 C-terminal domain-containing protein [Candidatus Minthomonas equi]